MVNVEIITIGDELLIGQVVDTNSAWIGTQMNAIGARISRITSISDSVDEIRRAILEADGRAQVVLTTGGLGPTKDDITKTTIAAMFSLPLVRDEPTYQHVQRLTAHLGLPFNELNQSQALVPQGCRVMANPIGTAPGMVLALPGGSTLFSMPGVPFEMKKMVTDHVIPIVREHYTLREVVHRTVVTFGLTESRMAQMLAPWEESLPEWLHLAYLPNPMGLRLRLSAYDVEAQRAEKAIDEEFEKLRPIIGTHILGREPATVFSAVAQMLNRDGATLAVAESCTGGAISARITAMEGASAYYMGGVTAYSNQVKVNVLGVSAADIDQYGAVSRTVAEQMAVGVRRALGADYGISTTGIAGPSGGSADKPVGTVWMALAHSGGVESRCMQFGELREQNIERAAAHAVDMLRLRLLER